MSAFSYPMKTAYDGFHFDHLFSQEYILKGVVNAALGQKIGSVSIPFNQKSVMQTNMSTVSPRLTLVVALFSFRGIN